MISKLISALEQKKRELSQAAMERPALDSATHGQNVLLAGRWQGIQIALDELNKILNEQDEV